MNVIATLRARATERRSTDVEAAHAAARTIATGGTVADVVGLETAMAGAGIDVEAFDRLVATYRERAADRGLLARVADAEAAAAKTTVSMEKLSAERARVFNAVTEKLAALEADRAKVLAVVADGRAARDRLLRNPPGPRGEALAAARAAHREAVAAADVLRDTIRRETETAARLAGQADDMERANRVHPDDIVSRRRDADRSARRAAEATAAMPAAEEAVAAAVAAVSTAEAAALET